MPRTRTRRIRSAALLVGELMLVGCTTTAPVPDPDPVPEPLEWTEVDLPVGMAASSLTTTPGRLLVGGQSASSLLGVVATGGGGVVVAGSVITVSIEQGEPQHPEQGLGPGGPLRRTVNQHCRLVRRRSQSLARLDALLEILGPGWHAALDADLRDKTPMRSWRPATQQQPG